MITNFSTWPSLKKNTFFEIKKNLYGPAYFKSCFETKDNAGFCQNKLYTFWHSGKKTPELAENLLKLVNEYRPSGKNLWMFYKRITKSPVSNFFCLKEDVYQAILRQLLLHSIQNKSFNEIKRSVSHVANTKCIKTMKHLIVKKLYSEDEYTRNTSYLILKSFKLIDLYNEDLFLTYYLLKSPKVGRIFNMSFKRLKVLGQNYSRRMDIVKGLSAMDPLPGNVFAYNDMKKRKILFQLLASNIPEYLKHYGKSCVSYLEGTGDYPYGTPTVQCGDFFKISQGTETITQSLRLQYSSALRPKAIERKVD